MATRTQHRHALPVEAVQARAGLYASGASGVHADQRARRNGAVGATNRVGSRAARLRVALADQR